MSGEKESGFEVVVGETCSCIRVRHVRGNEESGLEIVIGETMTYSDTRLGQAQ